jgi:hypothetical protein
MARQSVCIDTLNESVYSLCRLIGQNPTTQGGSVHECDLTGTDFRLSTKTELHAVYCFTSCGREANVVTCYFNRSFRGALVVFVRYCVINVRKSSSRWIFCKQQCRSVCDLFIQVNYLH